MCDYLRSNCEIDCKTVCSEVLKCTKEDFWDFLYKDFCKSDIIYMHVMSFMMLLESHDPK